MNVSLTPRLELLVERKVKSGLYGSASEVVREALRLLDERDYSRANQLAQLRADVNAGIRQIDAGQSRVLTGGELRSAAAAVKSRGRTRR